MLCEPVELQLAPSTGRPLITKVGAAIPIEPAPINAAARAGTIGRQSGCTPIGRRAARFVYLSVRD